MSQMSNSISKKFINLCVEHHIKCIVLSYMWFSLCTEYLLNPTLIELQSLVQRLFILLDKVLAFS